MLITLRYFAIVREAIGRGADCREVAPGTTVGALVDRLVADHPELERIKGSTLMMVNRQYVNDDHPLHDGDEVAMIPPVSGGSDRRFWVQSEPLDPSAVEALVENREAGAVVLFIGRVRDHARGQGVVALEYETYAAAAEPMLEQVGREIEARWGTGDVAIVHRSGRLDVGEASVVIAVAAPHRDEAYAASKYAIERIKEIVPIWKKEHYADGAVWIGSEADYQRQAGRGSPPG